MSFDDAIDIAVEEEAAELRQQILQLQGDVLAARSSSPTAFNNQQLASFHHDKVALGVEESNNSDLLLEKANVSDSRASEPPAQVFDGAATALESSLTQFEHLQRQVVDLLGAIPLSTDLQRFPLLTVHAMHGLDGSDSR